MLPKKFTSLNTESEGNIYIFNTKRVDDATPIEELPNQKTLCFSLSLTDYCGSKAHMSF
jgi:hypothetical protein